MANNFEAARKNLSLLKFVPASGAASRMFKALFNFLERYDAAKETLEAYLERTKDADIKLFSDGLERFAFYKEVASRISTNSNSYGHQVYLFVTKLLSEGGLNFGFYPKGMLPFHKV